jgi:phage nucleotide-binding protein
MKIISTKDVHEDGVKMLMYGSSGSGKTTLIRTAPNPFIISSESGLLALAGEDIPATEVKTEKDLDEAYKYVAESDYDTVCLDSLSDIAESILAELKGKYSDGRQAYGRLGDVMGKYIRLFRDLKGKNVYITAKEAKVDLNGVTVTQPSMPGQTLTNNISYFFDLVLRLESDKKGNRIIHTASTFTQIAKDRSGKLDSKVEADLGLIIKTIAGDL